MKVKAQAKYIRQSPFKVRRVLDMVRGMPVSDAQVVLSHLNRGASEPVSKVLKSAIANAEHNLALDAEDLIIAEAYRRRGPDAQAVSVPVPEVGRPESTSEPATSRSSSVTVSKKPGR